jgi:hypothetical protein
MYGNSRCKSVILSGPNKQNSSCGAQEILSAPDSWQWPTAPINPPCIFFPLLLCSPHILPCSVVLYTYCTCAAAPPPLPVPILNATWHPFIRLSPFSKVCSSHREPLVFGFLLLYFGFLLLYNKNKSCGWGFASMNFKRWCGLHLRCTSSRAVEPTWKLALWNANCSQHSVNPKYFFTIRLRWSRKGTKMQGLS